MTSTAQPPSIGNPDLSTYQHFAQALADDRGNRLLTVLCGKASINDDVLEEIYLHFPGHRCEHIDVLLDTSGGDGTSAYRAMEHLQHLCKRVHVIIPRQAWSAGTVFAAGASTIEMSPMAALGPIESQARQEYRFLNRGSALDDLQLGEELGRVMEDLTDRVVALDFDQRETASELGQRVTSHLAQQISLPDRARLRRDMAATITYTARLLRHGGADEEEAREIARKLAWSYGDHGYPITLHEAVELGLPVIELDMEHGINAYFAAKSYSDLDLPQTAVMTFTPGGGKS